MKHTSVSLSVISRTKLLIFGNRDLALYCVIVGREESGTALGFLFKGRKHDFLYSGEGLFGRNPVCTGICIVSRSEGNKSESLLSNDTLPSSWKMHDWDEAKEDAKDEEICLLLGDKGPP